MQLGDRLWRRKEAAEEQAAEQTPVICSAVRSFAAKQVSGCLFGSPFLCSEVLPGCLLDCLILHGEVGVMVSVRQSAPLQRPGFLFGNPLLCSELGVRSARPAL